MRPIRSQLNQKSTRLQTAFVDPLQCIGKSHPISYQVEDHFQQETGISVATLDQIQMFHACIAEEQITNHGIATTRTQNAGNVGNQVTQLMFVGHE